MLAAAAALHFAFPGIMQQAAVQEKQQARRDDAADSLYQETTRRNASSRSTRTEAFVSYLRDTRWNP